MRPGDIVQIVCKYYSMPVHVMKGRSQRRECIAVRQMTCYVLHKAGFNNTAIGKIVQRDRTMALHYINKITGQIAIYKDLQNDYNKILKLMDRLKRKSMSQLLEERHKLEAWLKENYAPQQPWDVVYDKIKELSNVNQQLQDYEDQ